MLSANAECLILRLARSRLLLLRRSLFFSGLLGVRRQDRVQRVAFLPRTKLHNPTLANVFNQALQNFASQAGARHLAAAEKDRGLDLVAFIQKTQHVILLGLVVVIVHVDAELHFFDRDRFLVLFSLAFFLLLLVQKFPVIHDAANWRLRGGRYLDQIQVLFAGHFERFEGGHNADLFTFVADHANFARANTLICADKSLVDTDLSFNDVG